MPEPEGAMDSAMHGPAAPGSQVRLSRTRTRNTQPDPGASGCGEAGSSPVRSALDVAKERWGTQVGPVTVQPGQAPRPGPEPPASLNALATWRIWSEPSPSMSAIWDDLLDGADKMADHGWAWMIPYWAFGVLAFPTACLARLLLDSSARPGRFAALILAAALFIAGLYVAGVI